MRRSNTIKRAFPALLIMVVMIAVAVSIFATGSPLPLLGLALLPALGIVKQQVLDTEYSINESDPNWTAGTATTAGSGDGVTEALLGYFSWWDLETSRAGNPPWPHTSRTTRRLLPSWPMVHRCG